MKILFSILSLVRPGKYIETFSYMPYLFLFLEGHDRLYVMYMRINIDLHLTHNLF
jgi:hypothetical protein